MRRILNEDANANHSLIASLLSNCFQLLVAVKRAIEERIYWCPTSPALLEQSETSLFSYLKTPFKLQFVEIEKEFELESTKVRTLKLNESATINEHMTPLVLIHGFASGVGFWILNLDSLAANNRPIYAFDIPGFGRSSRPNFDNGQEIEWQFVECIERWRLSINLKDKFILLGHGFGAFLALSYALHFPEYVAHIILVDPWGLQSAQQVQENRRLTHYQLPLWVKVVSAFLQSFNPLTGLRIAGPWGLKLLLMLRSDLKRKFIPFMDTEGSELVLRYLYHCNAQSNASGEIAFKALSLPSGWPRFPLIHRIDELHPDIHLTFIYGSRSWNDSQIAFEIVYLLGEQKVNVHIINGGGCHVFADKPEQFNNIVKLTCCLVDQRLYYSANVTK
ncbi:Abhydrolase domain-containing protein 4-like protein [Dinothrombium tinctorium]|uniref:Abhydrolase domain-containing protein 4-like protein n=3 Tax=Dinothrombium tinctorium TaxID=1965070 RepID=A0A3S3PCY6_9ACAR|nr:Abhydrolase domain-containing protein 4-like protein [Dinothrombium tinctorium]